MDGGGVMSSVSALLDQAQDLAFGFEAQSGNFVVVGFGATETVNAPFEITIELASHDPGIDLHALMDTEACLGIFDKYAAPRFLHGVITEVEKGQRGIRRTFYSVVLRPALIRLAHTSDSRIWQNKSVPEIAADVLNAHNIVNVEWRIEGTHEPREYATQYRETALDFLMRILAEEGIFYFFEHGETGHKLILTDAPLATPVLEQAATIPCNTNPGGQNRTSWISGFTQRERLRSSTYQMNEYTFKNPPANMKQTHKGQENNGLATDYALYDYPGRYKDPKAVGDPFTKHRIEAVRTDATTGQGETNNIHLSAGYHFTITDHEDEAVNSSHFILGVSHSGTQSASLEEDAGDAPTTYSASFTTMPARLPYRPAIAMKPVVDGPQIAIITGPEGEEIYTDEHGRVKVWFPWDRHGEQNEHSSCWIRVAQNWAGGTWGHMAIPRIGHEVMVDFLDGDPDQPIVTGRTYHATNRPPYKLPDHKTRMTIKSQTHKGKGYNELRFEDEKDREEIFVHAQRDKNTKVERNFSECINRNVVESVGHDKASEVSNTFRQMVGGDMHLGVGPGKIGSITPSGAAENTQGIGALAESLGDVGANPGIGNLVMSVEATKSQKIEAHHYENVRKDKASTVGGHYRLDVDKTIEITAGDSITIKVGRSLLTMDDAGNISINGKKMTVTMDDLFCVLADLVEIN